MRTTQNIRRAKAFEESDMRNKPKEFINHQKENAAESRADKATSSPARRPPQHDAVWQTADNERTSPVEFDTVTVVPKAGDNRHDMLSVLC